MLPEITVSVFSIKVPSEGKLSSERTLNARARLVAKSIAVIKKAENFFIGKSLLSTEIFKKLK
jgi:hypothetical protein